MASGSMGRDRSMTVARFAGSGAVSSVSRTGGGEACLGGATARGDSTTGGATLPIGSDVVLALMFRVASIAGLVTDAAGGGAMGGSGGGDAGLCCGFGGSETVADGFGAGGA